MPIIERPTFVGWIALVAQIPIQLFFTFWAGMFFGGITHLFIGVPSNVSDVFFGLAAFLGIPCISYFGKKLNYSRTQYKFFTDHLEFEEGFFSRNKKIVRYRDVLEVTLRRGMLQQTCNLGTIYLGTLATGSAPRSNAFNALGFGNISASGVGVQDILNPEVAYERIRSLVEAARP